MPIVKFQSPDEYVKDYEAYKKGYAYKVILNGKSEYVKAGAEYQIKVEKYKYWYNELFVTDLMHKFKYLEV
jgi:hypothetical protein